MDTWGILKKELSYYGIRLLSDRKCIVYNEEGASKTQGVIRTVREINQTIKKQKAILRMLFDEVIELLKIRGCNQCPIDDRMVDLFIFSLKDLSKFLMCFEDLDQSCYQLCVDNALSQDVKAFDKEQIYKLPDYKITIDWIHRYISRLIYVSNLLSFVATGERNISKYDLKLARGISGPWSNLDLPMQERVFPFGQEVQLREKAKRKQRRYRKGLENYNNDGRVGEGHYWRELRNEPFSWNDRKTEDPYPHRSTLNR